MVTGYPVAFKKKSFEICLAFVRGCGGSIGTNLREGPAVFYGVDESNADVFNEVRKRGDDFYYIDNSVFDSARQKYFRVTKNRLQHSGVGESDGKRFASLGIEIKPWRESGEHIVVCPQSLPFMKTVVGYTGIWESAAVAFLKARTQREIRVRGWSPNKSVLASTLGEDLKGAHALMTWSSAAAVTAVLEGVPVIVQGTDCAAAVMGGDGRSIEQLPMPDRTNWAGVLADNEFTLSEMTEGKAWSHLQT